VPSLWLLAVPVAPVRLPVPRLPCSPAAPLGGMRHTVDGQAEGRGPETRKSLRLGPAAPAHREPGGDLLVRAALRGDPLLGMAQPRDRGCDQPGVPDPLSFRDNLGFQERSPGLPGLPGPPVARSMPASLRIWQTVYGARLCPGRPARRGCAGSLSPACPEPFPAPAPGYPGPLGSSARTGRVPPDDISMQAQQGPGRDDQVQLAELAAGQRPGQRGQDAWSSLDGAYSWMIMPRMFRPASMSS
jgi:hypothetical protein